jgi:hypothetical protein
MGGKIDLVQSAIDLTLPAGLVTSFEVAVQNTAAGAITISPPAAGPAVFKGGDTTVSLPAGKIARFQNVNNAYIWWEYA